MTARTRVLVIVAAAAAVAVGATVGVVALTREDRPAPVAVHRPPYLVDLGVRDDTEARDLRLAARLYANRRDDDARAIFERYRSTEARVGVALTSGDDPMDGLRELPQDSALVRLHQGAVLAVEGQEAAARRELRQAAQLEPDTPYAVRADDFLHPRFVPGLPLFVHSEAYPKSLSSLSPAEQLTLLAASQRPADKLRYGAALQRLGKPLSARRAFDDAARASPQDPEALTAAAVGRFTKDDPAAAFSRLGPLAQRFPRAQSPRFHLGLLLLWIGDVEGARRQLRQARELGPATRLGLEAKRFLDRL